MDVLTMTLPVLAFQSHLIVALLSSATHAIIRALWGDGDSTQTLDLKTAFWVLSIDFPLPCQHVRHRLDYKHFQ